MPRTRDLSRSEVIKAAIDACIKKKRLLTQSELSSVLQFSTTKLRAVLGDKDTTESVLKQYLTVGKNGTLLKLTPKKDIEEETKDEMVQQSIQLQAENNMLRKEIKKLHEHDALETKVLDFLKDAVVSLPPIKTASIVSAKHVSHNQKELLTLWSDFHGSENVNAEEMGFLAEYNSKIMCQRFQYMVDHIAHKRKKYNNINTLNIALLGDMVSGIIHEELEVTNDMDVIMSVFAVAHMLAQGVLELAKEFNTVNVFGVPGNHGRIKKKPHFKRKYVNWDYVAYQVMKILLANQPSIHCDFPKSIFVVKNILDDNYLFLHGDNIQSWNGIPFYGISRTKSQLADILASRKVMFRNIFLGHFHNSGQIDKASGEIVLNGSLKGGDEFSLGKLFTISPAKQLLTCIEKGLGTTWRDPIILDNAEKKIEDKDLRYKQYEASLA